MGFSQLASAIEDLRERVRALEEQAGTATVEPEAEEPLSTTQTTEGSVSAPEDVGF